MKPTLDIETLTAYALGELEPADADAVKKALETDPEARKTLKELKATADLARTALHAAPQAALTEGQRATVMEEAESSTPHKATGSGNIRHVFFGKSVRGALLRAAAVLVVIGALYWTANDAFVRQTEPELAGDVGAETPAAASRPAEPAMVSGTDRPEAISKESDGYIAGEETASPVSTTSGTAGNDSDEIDDLEDDWGAFEVVPSSSSSAAVAVVKEKAEEKPAEAPESEPEPAAAPEPVVTEVPVETAAATEPAPATEAAPPQPVPPAPAPAKTRATPDPSMLRAQREIASPEIVAALDTMVSNEVFAANPNIHVKRESVTALDSSTLSIQLNDDRNSVLVLETTPEAVENVLLQDRFVLAMAKPEPVAMKEEEVAPPKVVAQRPVVESVPLPLELPEKSFMGTPLDYWSDNLEFSYKAREPLMVPAGTELLSQGKPVTSSDKTPSLGSVSMITDGDKGFQEKSLVELDKGLQWVQVDLGQPCSIEAIVVWHYHTSERVYFDFSVHVADDPDFTQNFRR